MWYTKDNNGYNRSELLTLYKISEDKERSFREDLFRFTHFYSGVCYAILAITLSGFLTLYGKGLILISLALGPVVTLCMCLLGKRVTSRIYRRIAKEISVKAKLENALGLDQEIPVSQFFGKQTIWEEDKSLLADRHAQKRTEFKSSKEFIDSIIISGFSKDNNTYFGIIAVCSIILGIAIVAISLAQVFCKC